MRPIKYLAFNGKELVPVISLDSMKDGEPIVLVSEDGSGDLPLKNLGKVPVYEFTGLRDIGRAEIYEGHVVKTKANAYVVRFANGVFYGENLKEGGSDFLSFHFHLSEVSGHISTNP